MLLYHLDAIRTLPQYHNAMGLRHFSAYSAYKALFPFHRNASTRPSILANPTVCSGVHRGRHRHTHLSMNTIYEHRLITRVRRTNQSPATQSSWPKVTQAKLCFVAGVTVIALLIPCLPSGQHRKEKPDFAVEDWPFIASHCKTFCIVGRKN